MPDLKSNEPMLDMYIFETTQLMEQLEQIVIDSEKTGGFQGSINEIFRIMHTVKGSSGMMLFSHITELSHKIEDLFYFLRESKPEKVDYKALSDIILNAVDFIRNELVKIENQTPADGDPSGNIKIAELFLEEVRSGNNLIGTQSKTESKPQEAPRFFVTSKDQKVSRENTRYEAVIRFEQGCEMENIRAFGVVHRLSEIADSISHSPENVIEDDDSSRIIRENGFKIYFNSTLGNEAVKTFLEETVFLSELELNVIEQVVQEKPIPSFETIKSQGNSKKDSGNAEHEAKQNGTKGLISISIEKTDRLMNLIGELVIAESMVTQCPDSSGTFSKTFQKAARHLRKITSEIQDVAMSIRMVPLEATFHKMQRLVRDMSRKMDKEVNISIIGDDTEVDKNVIEHISDPLMHLVRNAIDHGLETSSERIAKGKSVEGSLILEARNSGSEVLVTVKDDGKGLDREKILKKALANGLVKKAEADLTDRDIYNLIFLPGFSTKDSVTEYSGRGVGLDVVTKNIEAIGGSVLVESAPGIGTSITMKIPLTLAIIDGMNLRVGQARYTIPLTGIRESFRPKTGQVFSDPDGNEMITIRGKVYPILRLHKQYNVASAITEFTQGILIMVEQNGDCFCIFADRLTGQQQVVVKALPEYIKRIHRTAGLAGCTLLGDGSISLILDINALYSSMAYGKGRFYDGES